MSDKRVRLATLPCGAPEPPHFYSISQWHTIVVLDEWWVRWVIIRVQRSITTIMCVTMLELPFSSGCFSA